MKKTGSFTLLLTFLLLFTSHAVAQVEVNATVSTTKAFTGERITFSVEVSGRGFRNVANPELPPLTGLRYLNTYPSTSTSMSFVNGVSSSSYIYSYGIQAPVAGKFTIPPAKVVVDGTTYTTKAIEVEVIDRNTAAQQAQGSKLPDIFVKMEISETKPVVGQQIVATIVLYFRNSLEVLSYNLSSGWKAEGFWKEEMEDIRRPVTESVIMGGERFSKAVLVRYALFPGKAEKLVLSPYKVTTSVRFGARTRDPFGSFFGGFGSNQRSIELETDPISIDVKALPNQQLGQYIGAVGQFTITRKLDQREVKVGESLQIVTEIVGTGNIALIKKPFQKYPDGFEVYDPQESSNIVRSGEKIRGTKTFTDVVIPRMAGDIEIPEAKLVYYNETRSRYETVTLPAIPVKVLRDPRSSSIVMDQNVLLLQPIVGPVLWTSVASRTGFIPLWFWIALIFPAGTVAWGWYQRQHLDKLNTDSAFARSSLALKRSEGHQQEAKSIAEKGDVKTAYSKIHRALAGFIGDKLNLPDAGLSDKAYREALAAKKVDEAIQKRVYSLLDKCSTIRFAPNSTIDGFHQDLQETQTLIKELKRWV